MRPDNNNFGLTGNALFLLSVCFSLCLLSLSSCGKKGALTLASYEKPASPSLLTARHRENKIILSWEFPPEREKEIVGFVIMKSSGGEFERLGTTASHVRSFIDASFRTDVSYCYKVLSQNFRGILSDASDIVAITPSPVPGPPRYISSRLAEDSLELSWEDVGQGVFYNIYRRFEKEAYPIVPLNASPISSTAFHDMFFTDRLVHYTIRSLTRNLDEGGPSAELTVDPSLFVPPAPLELSCFAGAGITYLYWKAPAAPWIRGYKIYRSFDSGEYLLIGETQLPSFLDTDSSARRKSYRVTALGPSSEGPAAQLRGACDKVK